MFVPLEEYGETGNIQERTEDGENIEERVVFSRKGLPLVTQELRHNSEYDSDRQVTKCNFVEEGIPVYTVEAAYWLKDDLSISVLYGETAENHDDWSTEIHPFANITYYPDKPNGQIESCQAEYGTNGDLTYIQLEVNGEQSHDEPEIIVVKAKLLDGERLKQVRVMNLGEEVDDGVGAFGLPLLVTPTINWGIDVDGRKVRVFTEADEDDDTLDVCFPLTVHPSKLKKVLEQEKPLGGIYRKESPEQDIVEE